MLKVPLLDLAVVFCCYIRLISHILPFPIVCQSPKTSVLYCSLCCSGNLLLVLSWCTIFCLNVQKFNSPSYIASSDDWKTITKVMMTQMTTGTSFGYFSNTGHSILSLSFVLKLFQMAACFQSISSLLHIRNIFEVGIVDKLQGDSEYLTSRIVDKVVGSASHNGRSTQCSSQQFVEFAHWNETAGLFLYHIRVDTSLWIGWFHWHIQFSIYGDLFLIIGVTLLQ